MDADEPVRGDPDRACSGPDPDHPDIGEPVGPVRPDRHGGRRKVKAKGTAPRDGDVDDDTPEQAHDARASEGTPRQLVGSIHFSKT